MPEDGFFQWFRPPDVEKALADGWRIAEGWRYAEHHLRYSIPMWKPDEKVSQQE